MSTVIETIDLTPYGCPMHYIKAREALALVGDKQAVLMLVNNGNAVNEVMKSLRQDGHNCEIESENTQTITIRVTKA